MVSVAFEPAFEPAPVMPIRDPVDVDWDEVEAEEAVELLEVPPTTVAPTTLVSRILPSKNTTVWGPVGVTRDTDAVLMDVDVSLDAVIVEGDARASEADESCAEIGYTARKIDNRDISRGGIAVELC